MLTQKFLIFARPLPWMFFQSLASSSEDFTKPVRLLRVAMKIHNACVDVHMEEEGPHPSDFYGGYDTAKARAEAAHRGQAQHEPRTTSGRTSDDGSTADQPPTWTDEEAAAAMPPEYVARNTSKLRAKQMQVSKARWSSPTPSLLQDCTGLMLIKWPAQSARQSAAADGVPLGAGR